MLPQYAASARRRPVRTAPAPSKEVSKVKVIPSAVLPALALEPVAVHAIFPESRHPTRKPGGRCFPHGQAVWKEEVSCAPGADVG